MTEPHKIKHSSICPLCRNKGRVNPFALKPSDERFLEAAKLFLKYRGKKQQKDIFHIVAQHLAVTERTVMRYYKKMR